MTAVLPPRTALYDPAAVRDWLALIHGNSAGHVWIGAVIRGMQGRTFNTANPWWVDQACAYVDQLDRTGTSGIYLRTTTLGHIPDEGRGGDHDSHVLPGLAADLDIAGPGHKTTKPLPPDADAARLIIEESGLLAPSLWIHSGGGLYAWWLLDRPHHIVDMRRTRNLASYWQNPIAHASEKLGWSYGRLGDLARVLRIPGTVNRKAAMPEPVTCRIVEDTGRRYSLDNLRDCLVDALAAIPTPEPAPIRAKTANRGADDGLSPWDDYEQRNDWADILTPHGWTLHHQRGRTRYWTRPDKERRDGFSASTGRHHTWDRLWVFTDAAVGFEAGKLYTKFDAYKELEHGGNFDAAWRALRADGYGSKPKRRAA